MTHWLTLTNEMLVVVPSISHKIALLARVFESISTLALILFIFNNFLRILLIFFQFFSLNYCTSSTAPQEKEKEVSLINESTQNGCSK